MSASRFSFWVTPSSSVDRECSLLRKDPCLAFDGFSLWSLLLSGGRVEVSSEDYREVQEGTMCAWTFQHLFFRS